MNKYAFIFARGGSKGLKKKNIRLFGGKPLIAHSIVQANECKIFDRVFVSTDDSEIADISASYGAEIIISNTFATNKHALSDAGEDHLFEEYNSKAVQLAIEARELAKKDDILVAGGISYWRWPEGLPDKEQLYSDISEQAKIMATSGADLIMLEMMSDLEFTLITLRAAQTAGLPVWVGLSCKKNDKDQIC